MCNDCHTPRDDKGQLIMSQALQGAPTRRRPPSTRCPGPTPPRRSPACPPHFTGDQMVAFLETGKRPDGSMARPPMPPYRFSHEDAESFMLYHTLPEEMRACGLAFVLSLLTATAPRAAELKIATWNLNWLTSRVRPGFRLTSRFVSRRTSTGCGDTRAELDADVVAIEEVDNAETARRLFPAETYSIHMSHDHVRQRVGIAVRRGIAYTVNPDVTAIALDPIAHLRSGVDITLDAPAGPLRLLAVHLKQGCQYLTFGRTPRTTCVTLMSQFTLVAQWIAARRDESMPFVVLGDFNRGLDKNDPFIRTIAAPTPLTRATEGYSSPCWGHEAFIDHILIGGAARAWVMPNSLRVLAYRETDPAWKERLSDHCPVSVRLTVPD